MPNWTSNDVVITCKDEEQAKAIQKFVASEDNPFDFDLIIPMPASLDIEASGATDQDMLAYCKANNLQCPENFSRDFWKDYKPNLERGKTAYENIKKYGHMTWYDWRRCNWGTKWNSDDAVVDVEGNCVRAQFSTAWACPTPILERLSALFPEAEIVVDSDYEGGYSSWRSIFQNGKCSFEGEYAMHIIDDDEETVYSSWEEVPDDHFAQERRDEASTPWWNSEHGGDRWHGVP